MKTKRTANATVAALLAASLSLAPVTSALAEGEGEQDERDKELRETGSESETSTEPVIEARGGVGADSAAEPPVELAPQGSVDEGEFPAGYEPLAVTVGTWAFNDGAEGESYYDYVELKELVSGSSYQNGRYTVEASISAESGLTASYNAEKGTVELAGTPQEPGTYFVHISVTSTDYPSDTAFGDMPVTLNLTLTDDVYKMGGYPSRLSSVIASAEGKGTVWITGDLTETSVEGSVVPASVAKLIGVQSSYDYYTSKYTYSLEMREIGHKADAKITFASGARTVVSYIDFNKSGAFDCVGTTAVVESGADITFKNCVFANAPVVKKGGSAKFVDCTFESGTIEAYGTVEYSGTVEPTNTAASEEPREVLSIEGTSKGGIGDLFFDTFQLGLEHTDSLPVNLKGTAADDATVTASIVEDGTGLSATYKDGFVVLSGAATKEGTFTVEVTATAADDSEDTVTATTSVVVMKQLQVRLDGDLQAYTTGGTLDLSAASAPDAVAIGDFEAVSDTGLAPQASQPVLMTQASGAVSGGGSTMGTSTAGSYLTLQVREGDGSEWGDWQDLEDYNKARKDAAATMRQVIGMDHVSFSIVPVSKDGAPDESGRNSGMEPLLQSVGGYGSSVLVHGTAKDVGYYKIVAHVTDGYGRSAQSEGADLRVYANDLTFAQVYQDQVLDAANYAEKTDWFIEPYVINTTGNAVIRNGGVMTDSQALWINGSKDHGVYSIVGNSANADSETLTIASGANVVLNNMKVYSSVRIIVEDGAKLTLKDSVVYGTLENHGTLSTINGSTVTGTVFLMDGSTIENASLASHSRYLTDGNYKVAEPDCSFVVDKNATVSVKGNVALEGDIGASDKPGQVGLFISEGATVKLDDGAVLKVTGGDIDFIYPEAGGDGIRLDGGTIVGAGSVIAQGGDCTSNKAGDGIGGAGVVDVSNLGAKGGDSLVDPGQPTIYGTGTGGDAVAKGVQVRYEQAQLVAGQGVNPGSNEATAYDPDGTSGEQEAPAELVIVPTANDDGTFNLTASAERGGQAVSGLEFAWKNAETGEVRTGATLAGVAAKDLTSWQLEAPGSGASQQAAPAVHLETPSVDENTLELDVQGNVATATWAPVKAKANQLPVLQYHVKLLEDGELIAETLIDADEASATVEATLSAQADQAASAEGDERMQVTFTNVQGDGEFTVEVSAVSAAGEGLVAQAEADGDGAADGDATGGDATGGDATGDATGNAGSGDQSSPAGQGEGQQDDEGAGTGAATPDPAETTRTDDAAAAATLDAKSAQTVRASAASAAPSTGDPIDAVPLAAAAVASGGLLAFLNRRFTRE